MQREVSYLRTQAGGDSESDSTRSRTQTVELSLDAFLDNHDLGIGTSSAAAASAEITLATRSRWEDDYGIDDRRDRPRGREQRQRQRMIQSYPMQRSRRIDRRHYSPSPSAEPDTEETPVDDGCVCSPNPSVAVGPIRHERRGYTPSFGAGPAGPSRPGHPYYPRRSLSPRIRGAPIRLDSPIPFDGGGCIRLPTPDKFFWRLSPGPEGPTTLPPVRDSVRRLALGQRSESPLDISTMWTYEEAARACRNQPHVGYWRTSYTPPRSQRGEHPSSGTHQWRGPSPPLPPPQTEHGGREYNSNLCPGGNYVQDMPALAWNSNPEADKDSPDEESNVAPTQEDPYYLCRDPKCRRTHYPVPMCDVVGCAEYHYGGDVWPQQSSQRSQQEHHHRQQLQNQHHHQQHDAWTPYDDQPAQPRPVYSRPNAKFSPNPNPWAAPAQPPAEFPVRYAQDPPQHAPPYNPPATNHWAAATAETTPSLLQPTTSQYVPPPVNQYPGDPTIQSLEFTPTYTQPDHRQGTQGRDFIPVYPKVDRGRDTNSKAKTAKSRKRPSAAASSSLEAPAGAPRSGFWSASSSADPSSDADSSAVHAAAILRLIQYEATRPKDLPAEELCPTCYVRPFRENTEAISKEVTTWGESVIACARCGEQGRWKKSYP